tara:strand:+ start:102017 stop:103276 length:1260 start_codon:yes stop_codon:yes gene_type:complete
MGEKEEAPLPGSRTAVLSQSMSIKTDKGVERFLVQLPAPYINHDWPQVGGYPDRAMHHLVGGETLGTLWDVKIGEGIDGNIDILPSPIVAQGRVFAIDSRGKISAIDIRNGSILWSFDSTPNYEERESGFGGGLAYVGGRVFIANGFGQIIALKANTGKLIWKTNIGIPFRNAPVVAQRKVFAVSIDNQLWALDGLTGSKLWNNAGISESAGLLGSSSPAVSGELVLATYSSGEVNALRIENGLPIWSDAIGRQNIISSSISDFNDINGSPVIDRGLAYIISHGDHLIAIDIRSGLRVWERDIGGVNTPWIAGDFLYIISANSEIICLIRETGDVKWVRDLPQFSDYEDRKGEIIWNGPVLASDKLLMTSSTGLVVALSPYSGDYLGKVEMPDSISLPPIVADSKVFILTEEAKLFALR